MSIQFKNMATFIFPTEEKFVYPITDSVMMHIESVNHAVARIYFTGQEIQTVIPNEFVIYTWEFGSNKTKVIQKSVDAYSYALCWTDGYEIWFQNKKILSLENQRCWNIKSHS